MRPDAVHGARVYARPWRGVRADADPAAGARGCPSPRQSHRVCRYVLPQTAIVSCGRARRIAHSPSRGPRAPSCARRLASSASCRCRARATARACATSSAFGGAAAWPMRTACVCPCEKAMGRRSRHACATGGQRLPIQGWGAERIDSSLTLRLICEIVRPIGGGHARHIRFPKSCVISAPRSARRARRSAADVGSRHPGLDHRGADIASVGS